MQTKTYLHLLHESCFDFSNSNVFGEENSSHMGEYMYGPYK
jgi:hypothetical protein